MAAVNQTKWSKVTFLIIFVVVGVVGYLVGPLFFPMYRWQHVDLTKIAQATGVPEAELSQVYTVQLRYNPRRVGKLEDPVPWQVLTSDPDDARMEPYVQHRVLLLSDQTGSPPSKLRLAGVDRERFFTAKVIRLPPKSLGHNIQRPVLLYEGYSLNRQTISEGITWLGQLKADDWLSDDSDFDDYFDAGLVDENGQVIRDDVDTKTAEAVDK